MKQFALISLVISLSIFNFLSPIMVRSAFAVTAPSFPICANPQGTVKVSYSSGTHGIVGDSKEYQGSDTVYKVSDDTLTQCFCPEDGAGIQTNWWKASNLTDPDIQILKNLGWQYVPNGALWGLDDAPYLAQNSTYACKGGSSETAGSSASSDSGRGGSVLGVVGGVLGLASTGNISFIYSLIGAGFASLLLGVALRRNN